MAASTSAAGTPVAATHSEPAAAAAAGGVAGAGTGSPAPADPADRADPASAGVDEDAAVLAYLHKKGFNRIEQAFRAELDSQRKPSAAANAVGATPVPPTAAAAAALGKAAASTADGRDGTPGASATGGTVTDLPSLQPITMKDLAYKNAPRDITAVGSKATETPQAEADAAEALARDPTDGTRGYLAFKMWCEGSLEIYQAELRPLLLPVFLHTYLQLVNGGYSDAAAALFSAYSADFLPAHASLLSQVRSVTLPYHVESEPIASRLRSERYVVKLTQTTLSLLLGWLTDGLGPVSGGGAVRFEDGEDRVKRARNAVLKILNDRCRIQALSTKPHELDPATLQEGTGLTGVGPSHKMPVLPGSGILAVTDRDAVASFNASAAGPQLKLHPTIPMSEKLQADVVKELELQTKAKAATNGEGGDADGGDADGDVSMADAEQPELPSTAPAASNGLVQPTLADLPPQPPAFRNIDVMREVARILDARKALRFDLALESGTLGQSILSGVRDPTFNGLGEEGARIARAAAMPSICAYTYYDADDGLTCSRFSTDATLMAAGFEESYVQVWSLKGEKLKGLRSDYELSSIKDGKSLKRVREKEGRTTRKLIGHSGPVYSVDFDPTGGTAAAPKCLLSASADGTARLWSLDTFSALVAYRGHNWPVWNVRWSPQGTYFATASADRTARLWSTERINPLRIYAGHLSDVDCLDFHSNSLYLATGSSDRTCRLWDVQRGTCVRLFVGHTSSISCVRISPDGRYLASAGAGDGSWVPSTPSPSRTVGPAGDDTAISLWDLASGRRIKKMWGHTASIHEMDFSSDGNLLVSGGADCTVRCWDIKGAGGARRNPADGSFGVAGGADTWIKQSSADCVATFYTKQTPVVDVRLTPRNLCIVAGVYDPSTQLT